jgi:hypothetical protein
MASERQLQDQGSAAQEDSLGIQDAQQVLSAEIIPKNLDPKDNLKHLQQVDLLTKKLQDNLVSVDANATVD